MTADAPACTELWLVRHAPVDGGGGLIYGRRDVAAKIPGPQAIESLVRQLPHDAVWVSSPLRRAVQTLDAMLAVRGGDGITPVMEPGLAEQDFGAWEGQPADRVWGGLARELRDDPASITPPGGESFHQLHSRVAEAIDRLTLAHRGGRMVIVAHAGSIRATLACALALAPGAALRLVIDVLSISRCDHFPDSGAWRVQFVNRPGCPNTKSRGY